ncbi:MAG TPA: PAS domain-containing protein, partial [Gallionella sp.]|nr:PAS domain-containing protein [Gallionella sp.]
MQQEDKQLLSSYFDSAPGFFYTLVQGRDGGYAMPFASAGMRDLFGVEPGDVARDIAPFAAVVHPDDIGTVLREIEASARSLASCRFEYRIVHPQKGLRWIAADALPQRTPDGGMRWGGFMHDITERKRTEMELQRREREFRSLSENLPDVVVRYDRECRRIYVNPAWEKANGIAASEVIGKSPQELSVRVKPISADFERMLRGVMETGRPDSMVLNWLDEAGGQVYFELRAIPEFDSSGEAVSVLTVARDISEHRRMESELVLREQAYRSLTENLPDNIARMDTAGRVLYSNSIHQRSLGKPVAEMLGKTFGELFPDGRY